MANEKIYTQLDMDNRIKRELEVAKRERDSQTYELRDEIRDLSHRCKQKDKTIESLSNAIANLSEKGTRYGK